MSETKTWTIRGKDKPVTEYWLSRAGYLNSRCKICNVEYATEWKRQRLRDRPFQEIHRRKKTTSKSRSIQYDLCPEYLENVWYQQGGKCAVLGIDLDLTGDGKGDHKATIDRIIPSLGYTQGNIKWVSWLANRVKNDCTDPEVFIKVAEYVRNCNDIEEPEFDFSFTD